MRFLRIVLRLARRGLLCLLLLYWAVFAGESIIALVSGGPARVAVWYRHVFEGHMVGRNCVGDTCAFTLGPWDLERLGWGRFWAIQFLYLFCTLPLGFFEWRSLRKTG